MMSLYFITDQWAPPPTRHNVRWIFLSPGSVKVKIHQSARCQDLDKSIYREAWQDLCPLNSTCALPAWLFAAIRSIFTPRLIPTDSKAALQEFNTGILVLSLQAVEEFLVVSSGRPILNFHSDLASYLTSPPPTGPEWARV
jgi:hypothetical protein